MLAVPVGSAMGMLDSYIGEAAQTGVGKEVRATTCRVQTVGCVQPWMHHT